MTGASLNATSLRIQPIFSFHSYILVAVLRREEALSSYLLHDIFISLFIFPEEGMCDPFSSMQFFFFFESEWVKWVCGLHFLYLFCNVGGLDISIDILPS